MALPVCDRPDQPTLNELASGVDALYLSGKSDLPGPLTAELEAARAEAEGLDSAVEFEFAGRAWRLAKHGFITRRAEAEAYWRWHGVLNVRSRDDAGQELGTLSGGNQQKVLLSRWLERHARVLLLIEPTRGVDVGARAELYRSLRELAAQGVGMLVSTSDYEEVVQLADRAVVMARGRLVGELATDEITTERLTLLAGG